MENILATLITMGGIVGIGLLTGVLKIKVLSISKEERKQGKGGLYINGRKIFK
ncbi:hypothetical protein X915_gp030 [Bacillus phage vB_BanS-Tsamsa]|uniref:Uncharacterized protein n=2 Tax=Joanripponvirinae TaxID=3044646 RepID=A0A3Q9R7I3_9CAUD|nr:hypothetical protein X915_gp030 [Bacillus phage vB_BanS-Tsamsa]YP_010680101.1 hypothetical protein PQE69_gp131 [Bacillus phage pW2]AGI11972.1 hypothetical protein [Bacillus phage vB_BanS-Tsamsa]AZU98987.1 hypothetical protein pW2_163 [Bacillus phage pW2]